MSVDIGDDGEKRAIFARPLREVVRMYEWRVKWPRRLNPHYHEVSATSTVWMSSFGAFTPRAQEAYDRCKISLLASLAYPFHDKARLRTCCGFMNLAFLFNEYSNLAREDEVQIMDNIIMDVLRNPHAPRPEGEWIGGEVTKQFWESAIKIANPQSQKRFIESFSTLMQGTVQQAAWRSSKYIPSIQEYIEERRRTIGSSPVFALIELGMNLPDEVVNHPAIEELSMLVTDMVWMANDIASYNLEQARGDDGHNIVTILMHQNKADIQGAINWVYEYHKELEGKFMDIYENKIPRFGEQVDEELARYVDALGNCVRANDQWDFESERYFGRKGLEIQRTR
ncbi:terpenoid synthase [Multifurca ochricompacta]|uniref:Terpene synthase n=1 Tax=Multifurca ochricompacta TaxID=376703 RepID=A0AAD4LWY3_9AGAM|nr:terpenoid synthase [Multifurca ochricompacta]